MKYCVRITMAVALAFFLMGSMPLVFGVSSQDAATAIAEADHALQIVFGNVSAAERAGVNVTKLLNRLNEAALTLDMAEAAADSGSYLDAVNQATSCKVVADSVARNAVAMKSEAPSRFSSALSASMIELVSASVFVAVLELTWVWFKGYYSRKFRECRPEVTR